MEVEQDDTFFLRLSPLLALFAAWGTWMIIATLEDEEVRGAPPLLSNRVEVPGGDERCGATWVVSVPPERCRGPYVSNLSGRDVRQEAWTLSLVPMGGADAPSTRESWCALVCSGGATERAELVVTVAATGFRGRVRCDPAAGDPIDLYVGPVYVEANESVRLFAWRPDSESLTLLNRLMESCPYQRPEHPGELPASDGLW